MTGRHHRPPRLTARRVAIADVGLLALSLTIALAATWAPDARPPHAAALPTPVEKGREPSGHGGPIGPLATPSIGADGAWQPEDGPITYGQALPRPPAITTGAVRTAATPPATPTPGLPAVTPAPEPAPLAEQPAAPAEEPVVVLPVEPDITEPEATDPAPTEPPTEPPAEPVVEVTP